MCVFYQHARAPNFNNFLITARSFISRFFLTQNFNVVTKITIFHIFKFSFRLKICNFLATKNEISFYCPTIQMFLQVCPNRFFSVVRSNLLIFEIFSQRCGAKFHTFSCLFAIFLTSKLYTLSRKSQFLLKKTAVFSNEKRNFVLLHPTIYVDVVLTSFPVDAFSWLRSIIFSVILAGLRSSYRGHQLNMAVFFSYLGISDFSCMCKPVYLTSQFLHGTNYQKDTAMFNKSQTIKLDRPSLKNDIIPRVDVDELYTPPFPLFSASISLPQPHSVLQMVA